MNERKAPVTPPIALPYGEGTVEHKTTPVPPTASTPHVGMYYRPELRMRVRTAFKTQFSGWPWLLIWGLVPWGTGAVGWQFILYFSPFNLFALPLSVPFFVLIYGMGLVVWALGVICINLLPILIADPIFIVLTPTGVWRLNQVQKLYCPWESVRVVFTWNQDLILSGWIEPFIFPGDAFASHEEFDEFVAIVREAKRSNGATWRDEWNGRIFGVQSKEGEGLSIPL